jgi:ATP/maltotriose-dependent transcriptional regulator MalT
MALAWHTRGTFLEGRRELETLLRDRSEIPDQLRTRALWAFGAMLIAAGEFDRARPVVREAVASARGGDPAATARTLILLGELDLMTDPLSAQESLTEAVSLAREAGDTWCLADALGKLGAAALYRSDVTEAKPLLEECLQVAQRARDERSTHRALGGLARVAAINGQVDEALSLLDRSLELSQRLGDRSWIALDLAMQGEIQRLAGHPSDGETLAERGLALADEIGASYPRYMATGILGRTALARGDLAQAAARFERAIELAGQHGLRPFTPWWHLGLADVELARGDVDAAAARARDALASAEPLANRRDAGRATAVLGLVALARGEHDLAIAQLTAALSIQRELKDDIGARRSLENLASAFERSGRLERAERLRATLDRSAAGLDEAIALAMRGRTARRREPERGWAGLTGAEAEVAELAAAGASNPEIAKRLFMSRSTVKTHLSRVYAKLEVANRTELAAALAGQQGRPDS